MKLYSYFRSSASYRVRIALNLKGLSYEYVPVHLTRGGGEHLAPTFRKVNPQALVPVLEDGEEALAQSLAIIEYLDEKQPKPPLLPKGSVARARVRALALTIACEIHPLNNLKVLNYVTNVLGVGDDARRAWYHYWIAEGLRALEAREVLPWRCAGARRLLPHTAVVQRSSLQVRAFRLSDSPGDRAKLRSPGGLSARRAGKAA
jgi:maleylpyruvate isomerase